MININKVHKLPQGVQRFKTENQHIGEYSEKRVSMDFLDALMP